jgi:TPR repeat protein
MNKIGVLIIGAACAALSLQGCAEDAGSSASSNDCREFYGTAAALEPCTKAAEQGHAKAQAVLGVMHADGKGIPQDYAEAVNWYRKAAEQGYARAQFRLSYMYRYGKGVSQDYVMAHMFLNVASTTGSDTYRKARDGIAELMTGEQIAEAQRLAREWMERHPKAD